MDILNVIHLLGFNQKLKTTDVNSNTNTHMNG
jgi:hypothetical protein